MISFCRTILFIVWHQLFDLSVLIRMRDRLRCPKCRAVGTWKPHGGWIDESKESGRRWICKWCGLYIGRPFNKGPVIERYGFIDPEIKCWRIWDFYDSDVPAGIVPKEILEEHTEANPWNG